MMELRCIECGASATASCNCGAIYISKMEYTKREALKHPELSDNILAEKLKVSRSTVLQAREKLGEEQPTSDNEKRVGKDGKQYRAKRKSASQKWVEWAEANNVGPKIINWKVKKAKPLAPMPDDIREKIEEHIRHINARMNKLEKLCDYADQFSEELQHHLADEFKALKERAHILAKKVFCDGDLRKVVKPYCDVVIPLRRNEQ
jgi:DNA-binding transcriptional MocR family regulator